MLQYDDDDFEEEIIGKFDYGYDSVSTLFQSDFDSLRPYLCSLFWVDANVVYLNQGFNVSQMLIADYLGISQLGVSKRLHSAYEKIKFILTKPTQDLSELQSTLSKIVCGKDLYIIISLSNTCSIAITALLLNESRFNVTNCLKSFIAKLQQLDSDDSSLIEKSVLKSYLSFYDNIALFSKTGSYILRGSNEDSGLPD